MRTVHPLPYLLHALPSPLLYHLRAHQYLLMCTLHAPPTPLFFTAALCIVAPLVRATRPLNMCNTTPLVHALVV